jgi:putative transposase
MANLVSHSSSVGSCWIHLSFKVKYCHRIFSIPAIKMRTEQLLREAMNQMNILCRELGIDEDHVHFVLDAGLQPLPNIVKKLKGYSARRLMQEYPWLKKRYFWNSGLWNPSYFFDSLGQDLEELSNYVRQQGNKVNSNSTGLMRWLPVTGG